VPSGFANTDVEASRSDVTSTACPTWRAASLAETGSGRGESSRACAADGAVAAADEADGAVSADAGSTPASTAADVHNDSNTDAG
jgi:hypothetical protein